MLKKILLIAMGVVGALLGYAATQPDDFSIERSLVVKATPEKPFSLVNDFHQWSRWSPWEKKDAAMQKTHRGPASGVGAIYEWQGNREVGEGRMEIIESIAPKTIKIKLDFITPMAASNTVVFSFQPQDEATNITWSMSGKNAFLTKIFLIFFSMEDMVGPDFEAGLANLKMLAEQ
ncbi:SRPBCC family protein [Parvibium lacunae]|uniref:Polyketide cyclase n=1 Tax=Parvibium lacunae TaxID=1888893 RepID=A0A368KZR4_9BURK|nr:SRPBCC family protein [Parvibium lacunae]RCS56797.1 polyketide cyclase [Parvibium lacunae]